MSAKKYSIIKLYVTIVDKSKKIQKDYLKWLDSNKYSKLCIEKIIPEPVDLSEIDVKNDGFIVISLDGDLISLLENGIVSDKIEGYAKLVRKFIIETINLFDIDGLLISIEFFPKDINDITKNNYYYFYTSDETLLDYIRESYTNVAKVSKGKLAYNSDILEISAKYPTSHMIYSK